MPSRSLNSAAVESLDRKLDTPMPMQILRRGRYLFGFAVAAGAFALLSHGDVAEAEEYTVQKGDTLSQIAGTRGVSVSSLAAANGLGNKHAIVAGKTLNIPSAGSTTASPKKAKAATKSATKAAKAGANGLPSELSSSSRKSLQKQFASASKSYGLPGDLLPAMAYQESGWNNTKVSSVGAQGIGQLMPGTSKFVNENLVSTKLDPSVPEQNIKMSAAYMRYLLDQTGGDTSAALAAYYQGLNAVQNDGVYNETHQYVRSVRALQNSYFH